MLQESGKLTYFGFTRTSVSHFKKEKYLFYQIPEKPTTKSPTCSQICSYDVYLNKK